MNSRIRFLKCSDVDRPPLRRPPPRWARLAAWGAFTCTVPSAIWRILMIEGLIPGTLDLRYAYADHHTYVWSLSLVQLAAGFLTVGLVRPWGEYVGRIKVPRWAPIS